MLNLTTVDVNNIGNFSDDAIKAAIAEYVKTKPVVFSTWLYSKDLCVVNYKLQDKLYLQTLESEDEDDHIFDYAFDVRPFTETEVSYEYDDGDLVIDE